MRTVVKAMLAILLVVGPIAESSLSARQDLGPQDYLPTQWTIEKGLPQNTVRSLCRTPDGYLWLGTRSGIVRFDGMRFHVLNRWNSPLLPSEEVTALFPEPTGGLWVGTTAGLAFLGSNGWEAISSVEEGNGVLFVTALTRDDSGTIWVGTLSGLFQVKKGSRLIESVKAPDQPDSVVSLARNHRGGIYVGAGDGRLLLCPEDRPARMRKVSDVPGRIRSVVVGEDQGLWLASSSGLFHMSSADGKLIPVGLKEDARPISLLPVSGSRLWVGTRRKGLYLLEPDRIRQTRFSLFEDRPVLSMIADREGNIWVGTDVSGLFRMRKRFIRSLGAAEGPITAVVEGDPGETWMIRRQGGVVRFHEGSGSTDGGREEFESPNALCLWKQEDDLIWTGTQGQGVLGLTAENLGRRPFLTGLNISINALIEDTGGEIWAATDKGLFHGVSGMFQPASHSAGRKAQFSSLLAGPEGVVWAGGNLGVWQYRSGIWKSISSREDGSDPREVTTLFRDKNGILWAGTRGWGLFGYREGQWFRFDEEKGLPDNYILGILQDDMGYLWCGCHRGVFRIQAPDTGKLLSGKSPLVDCVVWNESEGMANSECTADAQPSAWKTHDGRLLFTTVQGVADVDPAGISRKPPRIPVIIENVLADSRLMDVTGPAKLSGKVEMMEIYYTCASLTSPEKVVFRYRLRGFDDRWTVSEPGHERTALYLNLGPGAYAFEISARTDTGLWTRPRDAFSFRISRETPFLLLIPLLAVILASAFLLKRRYFPAPTQEKYRTSGLTPDVAKSKLNDLLKLMDQEKPYLDADLNLSRLAKILGLHTNYLSRIINEYRKQSFNDFINQYRIQEAQARLKDPDSGNLTILQIAYETGFYSKSVFNTAFKKFTGKTPSQFRREARSG